MYEKLSFSPFCVRVWVRACLLLHIYIHPLISVYICSMGGNPWSPSTYSQHRHGIPVWWPGERCCRRCRRSSRRTFWWCFEWQAAHLAVPRHLKMTDKGRWQNTTTITQTVEYVMTNVTLSWPSLLIVV